LQSQTKVISGMVLQEDLFEPLPYISITINDTIEIGKTNENGFYNINISDTTKHIQFHGGFLETAKVILVDNCNIVDVVIMYEMIYDFMSNRKVDRDRMKRFKQLPKLHKQAYEKGIFKTEQPCYTREFIPYYKGKKKKAE